MILNECKFCGDVINVDLRDAWVCPNCNAIHQTTLKNEVVAGIHIEEIEVTNELGERMITVKFNVIDGIVE